MLILKIFVKIYNISKKTIPIEIPCLGHASTKNLPARIIGRFLVVRRKPAKGNQAFLRRRSATSPSNPAAPSSA